MDTKKLVAAVSPAESEETAKPAVPPTTVVDKPVAAPALSVGPVSLKNVFQHPEAHPYVLDVLLISKYAVEWLLWEPETLAWRIAQDFGLPPSDLCMHKLQAMRTLHRVDSFWTQWEVFGVCCAALNATMPDFFVAQVPSAVEALLATSIARSVRELPWSDEVRLYLESVLKHDGVFVGVDDLADIEVSDAELYGVDTAQLRMLWPEVLSYNKPPTAESINAEQLRRMFAMHAALENDHAVRAQQMKEVLHVTVP